MRPSWERVFLFALSIIFAIVLCFSIPQKILALTFFIIPIILAASYYGLAGGLGCAALCSGLAAAVMWMAGEEIGEGFLLPQIILFFLVGGFAGFMQREQDRVHQALHLSSITDELTGLYNYQHFRTRLDEEVRRAKRYGHPLALIMCDIDRFKKFNDTFGHSNGNFILNKIACLIRDAVRESDIPFRYGGDEFAVILPETGGEAAGVARRLEAVIADDFSRQYADEGVRPRMSVGVAFRNADAPLSGSLLISFADQALYKAKRSGSRVESFSLGETAPS